MKAKRRVFLKKLAVLGGLSFAGIGIARNSQARKFLSGWGQRIVSHPEKVGEQGRVKPRQDHYYRNAEIPHEREYRAFIQTLGLMYFSAEELIRPHRNVRYGVQNTIPPKELWESLVPTLRVADTLRARLNVRVTVLSAYRSFDYNSAIGGASRSQHMRNRALDLRFDCSSDEAYAMAVALRQEGGFKGGIGWYPSFIHIDTRGQNVEWGKDDEKSKG